MGGMLICRYIKDGYDEVKILAAKHNRQTKGL